MKFEKYGLQLERLKPDELSTVWKWRNDERVRMEMERNHPISFGNHEKWYAKLSKNTDFYFIIRKNNQELGLVNIKNINWESKTGESGIFMNAEHPAGTNISVLAVLSLIDLAFNYMGLHTLRAKIRKESSRNIYFNTSLGYEIEEKGETFDYYHLSESSYLRKTEKLRAFCDKKYSKLSNITISENQSAILNLFTGSEIKKEHNIKITPPPSTK